MAAVLINPFNPFMEVMRSGKAHQACLLWLIPLTRVNCRSISFFFLC